MEYEDVLLCERAPQVAIDYYMNQDMYLYDTMMDASNIGNEMSSNSSVARDNIETKKDYGKKSKEVRRPVIENLYDVFQNIRDDESEHGDIMRICQDKERLNHSLARKPTMRDDFSQKHCNIANNDEIIIQIERDNDRYCEGLLECVMNDLVPQRYSEKKVKNKENDVLS